MRFKQAINAHINSAYHICFLGFIFKKREEGCKCVIDWQHFNRRTVSCPTCHLKLALTAVEEWWCASTKSGRPLFFHPVSQVNMEKKKEKKWQQLFFSTNPGKLFHEITSSAVMESPQINMAHKPCRACFTALSPQSPLGASPYKKHALENLLRAPTSSAHLHQNAAI